MKWFFCIFLLMLLLLCFSNSNIRQRDSFRSTSIAAASIPSHEQVKHIIHIVWGIFDAILMNDNFFSSAVRGGGGALSCNIRGCVHFLLHLFLTPCAHRGIAVYDIWHQSLASAASELWLATNNTARDDFFFTTLDKKLNLLCWCCGRASAEIKLNIDWWDFMRCNFKNWGQSSYSSLDLLMYFFLLSSWARARGWGGFSSIKQLWNEKKINSLSIWRM